MEGARDRVSGISSGVGRREGRGGGLLGVGVELAEESRLEWELPLPFPVRLGGGGGGTVRLGRDGGFVLVGETLPTLSPELSERP